MDHKVILTPPAIEDLRKIVEYINHDNPTRAFSFGEELLNRALDLGKWPDAGRTVPEICDPTVREVIHRPYRIIYKVYAHAQVVYIVRFWHAARGEPDIPPKA